MEVFKATITPTKLLGNFKITWWPSMVQMAVAPAYSQTYFWMGRDSTELTESLRGRVQVFQDGGTF